MQNISMPPKMNAAIYDPTEFLQLSYILRSESCGLVRFHLMLSDLV